MLARKEDEQNVDWVRDVQKMPGTKLPLNVLVGSFEQSWLMQMDEEMFMKVSGVGWQTNEDGLLAPGRSAYLCLI